MHGGPRDAAGTARVLRRQPFDCCVATESRSACGEGGQWVLVAHALQCVAAQRPQAGVATRKRSGEEVWTGSAAAAATSAYVTAAAGQRWIRKQHP